MGLKFDPSDLARGLNDTLAKSELAVRLYADTAAIKLQNDAKKNAKWTDRTGAARNRLTGYTEPRPSAVRIILAHGVDYGIWLELAHEKRYAILQPTIDLKSAEILKGLDGLLNRIGR